MGQKESKPMSSTPLLFLLSVLALVSLSAVTCKVKSTLPFLRWFPGGTRYDRDGPGHVVWRRIFSVERVWNLGLEKPLSA